MMNINLTKNKLAKRSLGLAMIVGFAFMGVIACPSSGSGGGDTPAGNGGGNGGGDPVRCTETDTSLDEVTNLAVTPAMTVTDVNDALSLTLTWTEPTASGFTGVEITGGTPALASPIMVAAGTQTRVIMGLTPGEMSTFFVKSMYGTNCSMGVDANGVTPALPEVTDPTATPATVVTGPNDASSITLTWTQPEVSGFTGVEISGGTPALANPIMVAAGTQTTTITGLTVGTASTYTVRSVYGTNSSTGIKTTVTPNGAIALFSLERQNGDFGFMACQTAIDNAANSNLRSRGYTQARFFGSTDSYNYNAIHTDTDALGISGVTTIGDYTIAAFTDLTGTTAPTTTFAGTPSAGPRTLSSILTLSGNDWSANSRTVVETVTNPLDLSNNGVWMFTDSTGAYSSGLNCNGATDNTNSRTGGRASGLSITADSSCNSNKMHVLCVAR